MTRSLSTLGVDRMEPARAVDGADPRAAFAVGFEAGRSDPYRQLSPHHLVASHANTNSSPS